MSSQSAGREDPGDAEVEVVVRDRGAGIQQSRGTIVLEDLTSVVTRTLSSSGPNGPNAPVTQYILAQATRQLSDRLLGDLVHEWDMAAPKVLSALVGHEPFVERALNLSPHHMRRRWPMAADWYADLVSYALRPHRYVRNEQNVSGELSAWLELPFGLFIRRFAEHQVRATQDAELFRLAESLYTIWPDYEPIQKAYGQYRSAVERAWIPLYELLLRHYRLTLRPGVDLRDICWVLDVFVTQEGRDQALGLGRRGAAERASRAVLTYVAGAVMSEDSTFLTLREISERPPGLKNPA